MLGKPKASTFVGCRQQTSTMSCSMKLKASLNLNILLEVPLKTLSKLHSGCWESLKLRRLWDAFQLTSTVTCSMKKRRNAALRRTTSESPRKVLGGARHSSLATTDHLLHH